MRLISATLMLLLCSISEVSAQSILTASAGVASGSSASLIFNLGEPAVGTFQGESVALIAGFTSISQGIITSNDIDEMDIPDKFEISQNYPNPFNPSTNIDYSLPETSDVLIEVYNSIGVKVATLINTRQTAGRHKVTFNAGSVSSGMYFYTMQVNGKLLSTKKMILVK
tara:strand:+ start:33721 stop:34227 length:507 start_codon:yes stop_codon:yes gene_type:complete